MGIEEVIMGGIVFKGQKETSEKDKERDKNKVKTKAKKKSYIVGAHGSGAAKMREEFRRKRANRSSRKKK